MTAGAAALFLYYASTSCMSYLPAGLPFMNFAAAMEPAANTFLLRALCESVSISS